MANSLPKRFFLEYGSKINVEPALLKAVQLVESGSRNGFLESGKPQILFEGQVFYKLIVENFGISEARSVNIKHPKICYPSWDRTKYLGGEKEWTRLDKARTIYPDLADMATSWGMFQIMGFNYSLTGCTSIQEFVDKMSTSREEQFILGINFMEKTGCLKYLRAHEWAKFAKAYNGPGYAQQKYDKILESTYKRVTNDF